MILKNDSEGLRKDGRVLREARSLTSAEHDVTILLTEYLMETEEEHVGGVKIKGIPVVKRFEFVQRLLARGQSKGMHKSGHNRIDPIVSAICKPIKFAVISKILFRENSDVYHCHDFETIMLGFLASRLRKKKVVYDSHEIYFERTLFDKGTNRLKRPILVAFEKYIAKKAEAVITVNNSISNYLKKKYGIRAPVVIRNLAELVEKEKSFDPLRSSLGIDEDIKIVLYQGAFLRNRGLEKLVDAAAYIDDGVLIVIMGYGHLKEELKKRVAHKGLGKKVIIADAVNHGDLLQYTMSADLGISPIQNSSLSYYYSTPNKIWEYIAAGIPFLTSDFPEVRKLAVEEDMGEIIDPENAVDVANRIHHLLKNRAVYLRKQTNVKRLAREEYNWKNEEERLVLLYKKVNLRGGR
jgi:glycosyltransferase involved in cell wall biosynthesis